jgi:hypothetical protein
MGHRVPHYVNQDRLSLSITTMNKKIIGTIIGAGLAVFVILVVAGLTITKLSPAHIQVLDFNVEHTSGYIFTLHYVLSGHVINTGRSTFSNIQLKMVWK